MNFTLPFTTLVEYLLTALPIALGFFVQSLTGAGGGMTANPLLSLFIDPRSAVALVCMFQLTFSILLVFLWRDVLWSVVLRSSIVVICFASLGAYTLSLINPSLVRILLSFYIFLELYKQLSGNNRFSLLPRYCLVPLGGFINGMIGMGAPPFILWLQSKDLSIQSFRATMTALFFFTNITRIPVYLSQGLLSKSDLTKYIAILPLFIMALYIGHQLSKKISQKQFKIFIQLILFLSAISLLVKSII